MIVKLTEYEVSYLTKNDIFIGKKRFNLIQFEGGKGCNKSCVQDFYFFFFELIHSFSVYFISSLFPLLGVQRSQWHRNENIHVNNQHANNDTDRYYRLFLLSSFFFFFFFLRLEGVVPPADSTKPRSIDPNNAYNPYRCSSIVLSIDRRNEDTTPRWLVYPRCRRWNRFSQKEHGEEQEEEENHHWEILLLEWNVHPKK